MLFSFIQLKADDTFISGQDLLTGKEIKFFSGEKALVLVFVSSVCPCSHSHFEEINSISKLYSDFEFLGIFSNYDEDLALAKKYFLERSPLFPILDDQAQSIANKFKAFKTPHVFIVDKNKNIIYSGAVTDKSKFNEKNKNYLRDALEDVRANRPIRTARSRPLGCEILRP